jgi:cellulose synthase/poly-beta-1,6-N-acetylglucosamine synthase-like glycosyltransferase
VTVHVLQPVVVGLFVLVQALLLTYAAHRYLTLWRYARRRGAATPCAPEAPGILPHVTVQLPLYNERRVAERLIDAVAALDYPASRLQIQVLDDSTDETFDRAVAAAARHRARGIDIEVLHRGRRERYKAGALAAGLERAHGSLIVIFDADFVPGADFLRRVVPSFSAPDVGMVQARWGHLNRGRSLLTAAQAAMLDAHFLLEHEARMGAGLFFNFNGTAGAWRRTCIESAGGWSHDTLTEDLELSYRAQLAGWRFVSLPLVVAPAELPADIEAFKSQQHRWAKGSIQTARKLLPAILRSAQPLGVKVEACFHLTNNVAYPLMLLSALLLLPVMMMISGKAPRLSVALDLVIILAGVVPVCAFLAAGQLAAGARGWGVVRDVIAVLVLGAGLSVSNAGAVLQGLGRRVGDWNRTPKTGDGGRGTPLEPYAPRRSWSGGLELLLALCTAWLSVLAWRAGQVRSMPFLLVLGIGLAYVGTLSVRHRLRTHARRPPSCEGGRRGCFLLAVEQFQGSPASRLSRSRGVAERGAGQKNSIWVDRLHIPDPAPPIHDAGGAGTIGGVLGQVGGEPDGIHAGEGLLAAIADGEVVRAGRGRESPAHELIAGLAEKVRRDPDAAGIEQPDVRTRDHHAAEAGAEARRVGHADAIHVDVGIIQQPAVDLGQRPRARRGLGRPGKFTGVGGLDPGLGSSRARGEERAADAGGEQGREETARERSRQGHGGLLCWMR